MEKNMNKIFCGKSEEVIDELPDKSVNLIITSPPYNIDLGNKKVKSKRFKKYDEYEDNISHEQFLNDRRIFFEKAKRILKDDARIIINISDDKNGRIPLGADIVHLMVRELGYKMYTTIVWNKSNQTSNRCSWGSFMSPVAPSFPTPFEWIYVFYNKTPKLIHRGITDLDRKEFVDWSLAYWNFSGESKMKQFDHPAMFPEELPKRCIKMFSFKGDVVLDPYNGVGTTCLVAKKFDRKYIGIDLSEEYCKKAESRLKTVFNREELNTFFPVETY
jgi:DNA modification methylase